MTKTVRIENACNSDFTMKVQAFEMRADGDILVEEFPLNHPTALKEIYITSTRYLKIMETGIRPK